MAAFPRGPREREAVMKKNGMYSHKTLGLHLECFVISLPEQERRKAFSLTFPHNVAWSVLPASLLCQKLCPAKQELVSSRVWDTWYEQQRALPSIALGRQPALHMQGWVVSGYGGLTQQRGT